VGWIRRSKEEDNTDTLWHAHKHTRTHTPRRPEKEDGKQRHESDIQPKQKQTRDTRQRQREPKTNRLRGSAHREGAFDLWQFDYRET